MSTRSPGKGGQSSHAGNRGGQGKRGPNQRVPNNPGQHRGRKKNRRGVVQGMKITKSRKGTTTARTVIVTRT